MINSNSCVAPFENTDEFLEHVNMIPNVLSMLSLLQNENKTINISSTNDSLFSFLQQLPNTKKHKREALRTYKDILKCEFPVAIYSNKENILGLTLSELMSHIWHIINLEDNQSKDKKYEKSNSDSNKHIMVKALAKLEPIRSTNAFKIYNQLAFVLSQVSPKYDTFKIKNSLHVKIANTVIKHHTNLLSHLNYDHQHKILATWFYPNETLASKFRESILLKLESAIYNLMKDDHVNSSLTSCIQHVLKIHLYFPRPYFDQNIQNVLNYYARIQDFSQSNPELADYCESLKIKVNTYSTDLTTCPAFELNLINITTARSLILFTKELYNEYLIYQRHILIKCIKELGLIRINDESGLMVLIGNIYALSNVMLTLDDPNDGFDICSTYCGLAPWYHLKSEMKDFIDPYDTPNEVFQDLGMPFKGIYNIISGTLNMLFFPTALFNNDKIQSAILSINKNLPSVNSDKPIKNKLPNYTPFKDRFLFGLMSVLHGIIQIIATPYHWIKIPVRLIRTCIIDKKIARYENAMIVDHIKKSNNTDTDTNANTNTNSQPESSFIIDENHHGQFAKPSRNYFPSLSNTNSDSDEMHTPKSSHLLDLDRVEDDMNIVSRSGSTSPSLTV